MGALAVLADIGVGASDSAGTAPDEHACITPIVALLQKNLEFDPICDLRLLVWGLSLQGPRPSCLRLLVCAHGAGISIAADVR